MSASISFENVSKIYVHATGAASIFHEVSYTFEQGKSYALMGASGAGKSTCLHLLAGIDQPSSGRVLYNHENIAHFTSKRSALYLHQTIGFVFQQPCLFAELTVLENVMLKAILSGSMNTVSYNRAYALLHQVGLQDKAHMYPASLSGGQQQRVALLRAIFIKPEFLLVDEPTGNLDDATGRQVMDLMVMYQKEYGIGLIMSTHNTQFAQKLDIIVQISHESLCSL